MIRGLATPLTGEGQVQIGLNESCAFGAGCRFHRVAKHAGILGNRNNDVFPFCGRSELQGVPQALEPDLIGIEILGRGSGVGGEPARRRK